jgi:hypothetical protein
LAKAGIMDRPVLDNWDRLVAYLSVALTAQIQTAAHVVSLQIADHVIVGGRWLSLRQERRP